MLKFRISSRLLLMSAAFMLLVACGNKQAARMIEDFNTGWKFTLSDSLLEASAPGFDDQNWRLINLPHDWSIEGPFSSENPATPGGGALPGGIGWYRKTFKMSDDSRGKLVFTEFDGVYQNSEVWINGHYLGFRPNGYISFAYQLNPYIHFGDTLNTIAVRVDNSRQPNSRWYSGSGIYRDVRLLITDSLHLSRGGIFVRTENVSEKEALVRISVNVRNEKKQGMPCTVESRLIDSEGFEVGTKSSDNEILGGATGDFEQEIKVENPSLWSDKNPVLYRLVTSVYSEGRLVDELITPFGIRYYSFDPEKDFILNGEPVKIKGVCEHHDLGALGAAAYRRAIERKLEILKEMGCNAIRTAHNPPSPLLLDLCDEMGFLVMDETFDMWKKGKTTYDYHLYWDEWHERDLSDHILRDRNHPSVIIWSIGNEILEQWDPSGTPMAIELAAIVRNIDPTRPITSACNFVEPSNFILGSGALDLMGFNYYEETYKDFPSKFPGQCLIGSETTSALQTRGSYDMPSDSIRKWPVAWYLPFNEGNPDNTCSAYDNCRAPWGATHEENLLAAKAFDFVSGIFVWTGFDYLGEPTPYGWPSRSSYFGIIDLAGFPKDAYYLYQSEWTDKPVLHLFPHWNWTEGDMVDVWAYTGCDEVELFLNGTSLGRKNRSEGSLHMQWRVPYEPGTLKAVGVTDGDTLVSVIETTGEPVRIVLNADRSTLKADGYDLSYVTITVVDGNGRPVPVADDLIELSLTGPGTIAAVDNGLQTGHEPFASHTIKLWKGKALAIIRTTDQPGRIRLNAGSGTLEAAGIYLSAVQ